MAEPARDSAPASSLWVVTSALGIIGLTITFLTAPFAALLGPSEVALRAALHGTAADTSPVPG